ncbi:ribonucleotide-diphosphate reductase subunit alpha, partial [Mycoplasmopsis pullorum]
INHGNRNNRALGLGAMNLHGFFAVNEVYYDSPEALEFTNLFFYALAYHAYKASNLLAKERNETYKNFKSSKYATGEYFDKYTKCESDLYTAKL